MANGYTKDVGVQTCRVIQNKRFGDKKNFGRLLSAGPADSPLHIKYNAGGPTPAPPPSFGTDLPLPPLLLSMTAPSPETGTDALLSEIVLQANCSMAVAGGSSGQKAKPLVCRTALALQRNFAPIFYASSAP